MVLITGGSGFLGGAICNALAAYGIDHTNFSLRNYYEPPLCSQHDTEIRSDYCAWFYKCAGWDNIDVVIHCAGRAHVLQKDSSDSLEKSRLVNVYLSQSLALAASQMGVRRFIYVSSAGVFGELTNGRMPFCPSDQPNPMSDYALSKWEAEQALWEVAANTGLEVVVVRPPLVYGPGAKGNLARLLKLVRSGVPLPLGAVHNQRSLMGLDNLVDLLIRCVDHPAAAGQTLLVSDGEDVSTPDLLRHMAVGLGRRARLLRVPVPMLRLVGCALGKQSEIDRLVGSLQIDSSHTRELLDWSPPVSLAEGVRRMVQGS